MLNATERDFPRGLSLPQLVAAQAAAGPDAPAVRCGETRLSYAQLEARSDAIAARLATLGARPGARVGVCLERSAETVAALLAVLKTGAAYVPLDPAYPAERLALMVEDAGCVLVLTERAVADRVPPGAPRLELEQITGEAGFVGRAGPDDLAYVIYTSGSTGRPKGVAVTHRNVVNLLCAMQRRLDFAGGDVWLAVTTISFDISVLELFLPLAFGGEVALVRRDEAGDGERLARLIAEVRPAVLQATPATFRLLLAAGWQGGETTLLCGGEAIDPALARKLVELGGGRFWNVYGPTETTVWSTAAEVREVAGERVPIGHPLDNTRLHILDEALRPVADGEPGELYIAGAGVARGYLGRDDLTAERFLPEPGQPGERMYRTGDRVRLGEDGQVEFLGRIDNQVKVRGFRIEPGEIEARLGEHPGVDQAVVVARPGPEGDSKLVAFVVGPAAADPEGLKAHLARSLPSHMVPRLVVAMESLPLTPNGKVDRLLLVDWPPEIPASAAVAPRDETEAAVTRIFEEVLQAGSVGVEDDFFQLGGTSLGAVRTIGLIERRLGRKLHVNTLYHSAPTAAALARVLRGEVEVAMPYLAPLGGRPDDGAAAPVFCLHTMVEGTVFFYEPLARRLAGRTLLGVLPRGLHDGGEADADFAAIAGHCAAVIRVRQPEGPVRLLGFSSAGVLAMETARQLQAEGREVASLGLIDAYPPVGRRTWRYQWEVQTDRLRRLAQAVADRLHALGKPRQGDPADAALRWRHRLAIRGYQTAPCPVAAALFVSQETTAMFAEPGLGWRRLVELSSVDTLAGGHYALVNEPGVEALAERVRARLSPAPDA